MKRILIIWALLIETVYAQSKAGFYVVGGKVITVQDTSSRNYLKAIENAGVVPIVLQNAASNFLVTSEKAIGSYSLITAQYPFIGGTANTHRFNINNPIDTDAAYRLTFPNGMTHTANGIQGNGTNQYAETFLVPNGLISTTSNHLSYYSNTIVINRTNSEIGAITNITTGANAFEILSSTSSGNNLQQFAIGNNTSFSSLQKTPFSKGFVLGGVEGSNKKLLTNGVIVTNANPFTMVHSTNSIRIGMRFNGDLPSSSSFQTASIGAGFTDTQSIQQSRIVTFFNSMQNR